MLKISVFFNFIHHLLCEMSLFVDVSYNIILLNKQDKIVTNFNFLFNWSCLSSAIIYNLLMEVFFGGLRLTEDI